MARQRLSDLQRALRNSRPGGGRSGGSAPPAAFSTDQLDRVRRKPSWDDPWSILSLDVDPATIPRPDEPKPPSRKPRR